MKVTIGDYEFDALTTVGNADVYLIGDVARASAWALRQDAAKGRGIVSASRMLLTLPWCATPPDPTSEELLAVVQEVTAMLAADLLAKPRLFADASGNSNVKSAKAGSAQVEFFAAVEGGPPIPRALWDRLLAAGLVCLPASGAGSDDGSLAGALFSGTDSCDRPIDGRYSDYQRDGWLAQDMD